jgi:hypothetical protein
MEFREPVADLGHSLQLCEQYRGTREFVVRPMFEISCGRYFPLKVETREGLEDRV